MQEAYFDCDMDDNGELLPPVRRPSSSVSSTDGGDAPAFSTGEPDVDNLPDERNTKPPDLNILVLGETGVGKSTFINAFVNYVSFDSLDDALSNENLQCLIPSSFTWQSLENDDYVAKHINVLPTRGDQQQAANDENDGTNGQSATQVTKTYTITTPSGSRISLIDTPGIGDTRGSAQDRKNMDDILGKLRTVKELHGILILLKPNNARLTVMFKFCLKELLSHLHRDAAKNIVFGFTNARNTSFRPGETYSTLKGMLEDDTSVGIQISRAITYCFDSESFRCLAANEQGINIHDLGDIEDYKMSWQKSAAEVDRMLQHLLPSTTTPHRTAETVDLHATRVLVKTLTIPMADITQTINNNIALQRDQQADVANALAKGEVLESALHLSKVVYEMRQLDRPHTVCSAKECVEFKDDKKHYKTPCHAPCYLDNIEVDKIQCPDLVNCAAFNGSQNCNVCGHSWQLHLHVVWEPVESTIQVEDEAVSTRLRENATGLEVMETALKSRQERIKKYEEERRILQKAAGQFAVFLKNNSIKPYNDSKLEYLDHLIEEEKGKVQAGGSRKKLDDFTADRKQHQEEIGTLLEYSKVGASDKLLDQIGINDLVKQLFALELSGKDLQNVASQLEDMQKKTAEKAKASAVHASSRLAKRGKRSATLAAVSSSAAKNGDGPSFHEMLAAQKQKQEAPRKRTVQETNQRSRLEASRKKSVQESHPDPGASPSTLSRITRWVYGWR